MPTFAAIVSETGLQFIDRAGWRRELQRHVGRQIKVTVSRGSKTNDQLGYYHSVVLPEFAEHYGEDSLDAMHYTLKDMFLTKIEITNHITGEIILRVPSLADLSVEQMSEFLERVIRQAALNGWEITPPRPA